MKKIFFWFQPLLCLLILLLFVPITTAQSCDITINSLPYNITQNNTYYCLATSSTNLAGTAIQFGNSSSWVIQNSTLDCQGYSLDGDDSGADYGVYLTGSETKNNTVKNCNFSDFYHGIYLYSGPNNNSLTNNTANSNGYGFWLLSSSNNTLSNNSVNSNNEGIYLSSSSNYNILSNNIVNYSNIRGIMLSSSSNNTFTNNIANSNNMGFGIYSSSNNTFTNNTANNNIYGFYLDSSSNNSLKNNTANSNTGYGVHLYSSSNSILSNNTMTNNAYNFYLYGNQDSHLNQSIDTSNMVDGKPIYYIMNEQNKIYNESTNAGFFACVFCNNVTVENLNLSKNGYNVLFWKTNNSLIRNNTGRLSFYGIWLKYSYNNTIQNNTLNSKESHAAIIWLSNNNILQNNSPKSDDQVGIVLQESNNTLIQNNEVHSSKLFGIWMLHSTNNTIKNNNITSNGQRGIYVYESYNSTIQNNTGFNHTYDDICLLYSQNLNLTDNNITSFYVAGDYSLYSHFNHSVDTSNTVSGKPIFYIKNMQNQVYDASTNAGHFACISCNNITVKNLNLSPKNYDGVFFWNTNNSIIQNITANSNNDVGISLQSSFNNTLSNNIVNYNKNGGIYVYLGSNNTLTNNTVSFTFTSGWIAIDIEYSNYTTVSNNTVTNNLVAFYFWKAYNNSITNNKILNNSNTGSWQVIYFDTDTGYSNFTNNQICYNNPVLYNDTATNRIDNNTFCVEPIQPASNAWYYSLSSFTFNVSNPLFTTSCQLYVDGSYAATNSSVGNHQLSTISYSPSQGLHSYYIYCNDSASTNWGNSSLLYFGIKKSDGSSCTASEQCLGSYCVHSICRSSSVYCGDSYCDSGESCGSCLFDCSTCPSTGIPSPIASTTPGKAVIFIPSIAAGSKASITIEKTEGMDFSEIIIQVANKVNSVYVTVTKLDAKPQDIPTVANVYRYVNVVKENIRDEDISSATIKFTVNKSWISANNINTATIALHRYANNVWDKLPTTKLSEDANYVYFESTTPGFSYFAISGEVSAATTTTTPPITTTLPPTTTTTTPLIAPPERIKWPYAAIVLIIILAIIFFLLRFLKKKQC